jgi:hypothetical protein
VGIARIVFGLAPMETLVANSFSRGQQTDKLAFQAPAEPESCLLLNSPPVSMDGLHGEGMPEHAGNPLLSPAISEPGPGEETCDRHHEAVTRGGHGLETRVRRRLHVAVHQDFPVMVHDTDVHAPGMEVDPAVTLVLGGVEAPEVSSSFVSGFSQGQHTTGVC